ncbi:tripartite tricarboxylate transporter substrate binding protein [soil metagenome]
MNRRSTLLAGVFSALTLVTAALPAMAQTFPNKPVHVIFPYPPGSDLDAVGRLISDRTAQILGQPFVFENRPGANGILGTGVAARAAPDGYTILLTTTSAFLLNSFIRKDLPYDPLKSFTPIAAVADIPVALMVRSSLPVKTTREFVQYLKENPGKLNYASVGNGSFNHLLAEQFKVAANVDMVHVPYQGAGLIANELIAGRIEATVLGIGSVMGQWKAGQVRVLSFMSTQRSSTQPDIPAISEDLPGFRPFSNWIGFVAPAGTPDAVVSKLSEALRTVLGQADVRQRIADQQWGVMASTPAEFRASIQADLPVIEAAFKVTGIKPE